MRAEQKHWWEGYPWRMVQTNFREIDMADVDAKAFAADLADFGATVVTLNAGGILASYDSKLPFHMVNPYLIGSSLRQIVDACHEKGIRVIARMDFSKVPLAVYEQNPEWAFVAADGNIVEQNGFVQTCLNSEYQQEKIFEILKELLTTHPFDGVYCNMSGFVVTDYAGNIHGMCNCDNCREKFRNATGLEAPKALDLRNPTVMRYMGFQSACSSKLRQKMNDTVKTINPEIALDKVDYLRSESHTEVNVPIWVYSASSNSRMTTGAQRTFISDNASVDFMGFRYRESSVSPYVMELRQWQNLANSGSTSIYIMGRLDNHKDKSSFAPTKKVFQFHKQNEELLTGLRSAAKVLLVCKNQIGRDDPESFGWIRGLTASHVAFDEIKASGLSEQNLQNKAVAILADVKALTDAQAHLLNEFASKGGIVVASGETGLDKTNLACMGVELGPKHKNCISSVWEADVADGFTRCELAPVIPFGDAYYEVTPGENTKGYLHLIPEHPYGPPEVCYCTETTQLPGITVHQHGNGKGVLIPWHIGSFYHTEGYTNTLNVMQEVLFNLCGLKDMAPNLSPMVELVHSCKEGKTVLSLINASGFFGNSFFPPVSMQNITLTVPGTFARAKALNGGAVSLEIQKNTTIVRLNALCEFEMVVLENQIE